MKAKLFSFLLTVCIAFFAFGPALAALGTDQLLDETAAKKKKVSDLIYFDGNIAGDHEPIANTEALGNSGLVRANSYANLLSALAKRDTFYLGTMRSDVSIVVPKTDGPDNDYSQTNIQVEGVDESDIIKTDGKNIFYCSDSDVTIFSGGSKPSVVTVIQPQDKSVSFYDLYLSGSTLVICAGGSDILKKPLDIYNYYNQATIYYVYDIKNLSSPKLVRTLMFEGYEVSSRLINDRLYFVSRRGPHRYPFEASALSDVLPAYRDSSIGSKTLFVQPESIYYNSNRSKPSLTMMGAFEIGESGALSVSAVYDSADEIYMNKESLYVTDSWGHNADSTVIRRYKLSGAGLEYAASGSVKGYVLNQYSMDEYKGVFRIAVSDRYGDTNTLYTLDANTLKEIGKVSMAEDERIYSVRYLGDIGYVVTYRETDPLFVIDLKNPKKPKILGQLKIPGFSDYLHPFKDSYLIGFGREESMLYYKNADGNYVETGEMRDVGFKLSLFDVSNPKNPKELHKLILGDSDTGSEASYNPKSIMVDTKKSLFAFTINEEFEIEEGSSGYGDGGAVVAVDVKNGFRQLVRTTIDEDSDNIRFCYIGNTLYAISRYKIITYDYTTFKKLYERTY